MDIVIHDQNRPNGRKYPQEFYDALDRCVDLYDAFTVAVKIGRKFESNDRVLAKDIRGYFKSRVPARTLYRWLKDELGSKDNSDDKDKPMPALPLGQFDVLYVDPPWTFDVGGRGAAKNHYEVMTDEEIQNLKIPAAENSVLFLWSTQAMIAKALKIIEMWGFIYHSGFVWVKDKFGTGFFVRGQHELLLIATKGKMPHPEQSDRPSSVIEAPRTEHSKKPDIVYKIIERMYPNREYLELFARRRYSDKWAVWGKEVGI